MTTLNNKEFRKLRKRMLELWNEKEEDVASLREGGGICKTSYDNLKIILNYKS